MANMPATAEIYKQSYCQGNFEKCARYIVAAKLGPEKVPATLFPNDSEGARRLIAV
jgi:hypothetical protein